MAGISTSNSVSILPATQQSPGGVKDLSNQINSLAAKLDGDTAQAIRFIAKQGQSLQDQINALMRYLRQPLPFPEALKLTDASGNLVAEIGYWDSNGKSHFGAWLKQLWVAGSDADTALFHVKDDGSLFLGNDTTNLTIAPDGTLTLNGVSLTLDAVVGTKEIKLDPTIPEFDITDSSTGFSMKINPTDGILMTNTGTGTAEFIHFQAGSNIPNPALGVGGRSAGIVLEDNAGAVVYIDTSSGIKIGCWSAAGDASISPGMLRVDDASFVSAWLQSDQLFISDQKVLGPQQPSVSTISGVAGASYTAAEQSLINLLISTVNTMIGRLRASTGHGLFSG